jgi:PAS domain S-box-containing protein
VSDRSARTAVAVLLVGREESGTADVRAAFVAALGKDLVFEVVPDLPAARARLVEAAIDVVVVNLTAPALPADPVAALVPAAGDASVIALAHPEQRAEAVAALRGGAQDYLLTSVLTPPVVEMTVRFAAERARTLRELRRSEATARRALSLVSATLEATADGILVVDLDGRVTAFNRRFAEMWRVPVRVLESGDVESVRAQIATQLRDTDAFFSRLRDVYATASAASYDVLELRDGRLIERYAYPQQVDDAVVGRVWSFRDVTHQRMAAAALHREHDLLTATIESTGEAVFAKDLEGRYLLMNTFAADLLGKDPVGVLGRRDDELFAPERARELRDSDLRIMETGGAVVLEEVHERLDGTRHMLVRKGPLRDRTGRIIGVIGVGRDVTDRRRAEQAVRDSEERYRAFIAQATEAVWRIELEAPIPVTLSEDALIDRLYADAYLAECNDAMARMRGLDSATELIGARLEDLLPRGEPSSEPMLRTFVRSGFRLSDAETRERDRTGQIRTRLHTLFAMVENGHIVRAWGTLRDVTERRRAEAIQAATYRISEAANTADSLDELLPEIHRIVAQLIPAANFYVALLSEDGRELTFPYHVDESDTAFRARPPGRGITEYVLRTGEPLLATPAVWRELTARDEVQLIGAPSIDWLGVPLTVAGRTFGVLAVQSYDEATRYDDQAKRILTFVGDQVANAIARQRAAQALRAAEERYRAFIAQSTEGVSRIEHDPPVPIEGRSADAIVDDLYATGYVAECNDAMAQMYGYATAEDFVGRRLADMHDRDDPANRAMMLDMVRSGFRMQDSESHERDRHGRLRIFRNNAVGFIEQGRLVRVWGTQRDITERRLLEEQLRQAQKLEAVGRLAGGIAHDFNNILTAILGTSDLMLDDLPPQHPVRADVAEVRKAALRAAELTRQLLAYSRRQVLTPSRIDLNGVVAGVEPMLRRLIGADVELTTSLAADLPAVRADASQLEQVILNLVLNARDAMPQGGRVNVATDTVQLDAASAARPPALPAGRYVQLAVVDTGVGMGPDIRAHLFEPFFTTKEVGKGTGLGLATVYGIVDQSGGAIAVDTEPGRGTTMRILLPPAAPSPAEDLPAGMAPEPAGPRGQTVLLVEDEDAVRGMARRALEGAGFQVLAAANGAEALALASDHPSIPGLLLTDLVMPGMNGRELARQVTQRWPGVPVLYMSGYSDEVALRQDLDGTLLQKPFDIDTLVRQARAAIERSRALPTA